MTTRTAAIWGLGLVACGQPIDDARDDEDVDRIDVNAPLAIELAPEARLVLTDATVAGVGHGTVVIEALAVDAKSGALLDLPLAEGATALRLAGPHGSRRIAAEHVPEIAADAHVVDAQLVALELGGFEAAWLEADDGRIALAEPVIVDARSIAWTSGELVVIEMDDDDAAAAGAGAGAGGGAFAGPGGSRAGVVYGVPPGPRFDALAHARGDDPFAPIDELVADDEPLLLEPGDACSSTGQCPVDTRCVADPMMSDGQFRCLPLCVEPELVGGAMPPMPSASAECVDDAGCCDPDLACSNGTCVVQDPGSDGGDETPTQTGSGCDRDDDGWVNGCDRKPDESCIHDNDHDGCADSFDDSDNDSCNCTTPIRLPRPNATGLCLIALTWLRGRKRR
ncbi:MAG TPA: hypothetical protein VFG69_02320 [Nannocystaceae bacterium]|nr:hypothetical protein [Nannocystaceae bacterium]